MRLPRKVALFLVLFLGLPLLFLAGLRWAGLLPPVDALRPAPGKEGGKPLFLPPEAWTPWAEQEKKPAQTGIGEAAGESSGEAAGEPPAKTPWGAAGAPDAPGPDALGNAPANVPSPLRREIEARYIARLEAICSYYEGKLNTLVGSAWNEYSTARMQGQKISAVNLAGKYLAAGNTLEKECDREFYAVLADFRSELRKHSLPLDKTYEAQREYERAKAARKRQILSAAAKFF